MKTWEFQWLSVSFSAVKLQVHLSSPPQLPQPSWALCGDFGVQCQDATSEKALRVLDTSNKYINNKINNYDKKNKSIMFTFHMSSTCNTHHFCFNPYGNPV